MFKRPVVPALIVGLLALAGLAIVGLLLSGPAAAANLPAPAAGAFPGAFFVHTAISGTNGGGYVTYLDHPLLNNNRDAVFLITHNSSVHPGLLDTVFTYPSGVVYNTSQERWFIFNEVDEDIPSGTSFNVYVAPVGPAGFVHTTTVSNRAFNYTVINQSDLNNDPQALAFVVHCNCDPQPGAVNYDHYFGVWYTGNNRWSIFSQDTGYTMETGIFFKVFAAQPSTNAFTHVVTEANRNGETTLLNHPLARGRPDAVMVVTQNYSPYGGGGHYNDHPIGVAYSTDVDTWVIFNEDGAAMPLNTAFNVLIDGQAVFVPLVQR